MLAFPPHVQMLWQMNTLNFLIGFKPQFNWTVQSAVLLKLAISFLCIFIALLYTASASRSQYDSHFILVWNFGISQRNCAKCLQFQGTPLFRIVLIKWWTVLMVDRDSWGDREREREREGERCRNMVEVGVHMTLVLWLGLAFIYWFCLARQR